VNAVLAIVAANLRRVLNDRANIFFIIILPLLIVFALSGAIAGSASNTRVGVVDPSPTPESSSVRQSLAGREGLEVVDVPTAGELRDRVARGILDAGWVVRRDGSGAGQRTTIDWVSGVNVEAAELIATRAGVDRERARAAVADAASSGGRVDVRVSEVTDKSNVTPSSIRAILAAGQVTLFMFLTSLFGASALLLSRQYGVVRRTRAAPVRGAAIIGGEALSRFLIALIQAAIIIAGTTLMFGVDWRSPVAVAALCAAMALVGSGVAMILGTIGKSEQQVGAIAMLAGLVLAALGGSMQPLEFFPDAMRTIAFAVTPHAWMNDAMWSILVDGAGIGGVWKNILVLTGVGVVLLLIASRLLARSLR